LDFPDKKPTIKNEIHLKSVVRVAADLFVLLGGYRCVKWSNTKNKYMKQLVYRSIALVLLTLQLGTSVGWANELTPAEKAEQNRRIRQEAIDRQQRKQKKDVFLQPETKATVETDLPEEPISFPIHTLELQGDHVEQFSWLQDRLNQYAGRTIGMQGINLIVKRLTNALIDRGYTTTRIVIPEQDLSTGILRLTIIPGVIRDIRFQDPSCRANWRTAFPTRPGDILNLRNLEQGLEQLKRVPSHDADMQLVPGDKPGQSDVVITIKQTKPWQVVLSLDDSGSEATGKLQLSETVSFDNLFNANDLFHVSFNSDGERDGQVRGTKGSSFYYSIPNGNWTFTLSQSHYNYHQTVPTGTQSLVYSGNNDDVKLIVERLLQRNQTSKTSLELGVIRRHSKNFVEDIELEGQARDTTDFEVAISHRQYFGQTTLDARLSHKQGVSWFGAQPELKDRLQTTRYNIWNVSGTLTKPVPFGSTKAQYKTTVSAQFTNSHLYTTDSFSIGNRYTVRGFDGEQTLAAERGWYIQNELSLPVDKAGGHQIYVGLDYGQVSGPSAAWLTGKQLAGTVLGLRGGLGAGAHYDIFVGWPLKKPKDFTTANPTYGFQLVYQL